MLAQGTCANCTWQNVQIREKEIWSSNLSLNTQRSNHQRNLYCDILLRTKGIDEGGEIFVTRYVVGHQSETSASIPANSDSDYWTLSLLPQFQFTSSHLILFYQSGAQKRLKIELLLGKLKWGSKITIEFLSGKSPSPRLHELTPKSHYRIRIHHRAEDINV